jgi:hypothetical protein
LGARRQRVSMLGARQRLFWVRSLREELCPVGFRPLGDELRDLWQLIQRACGSAARLNILHRRWVEMQPDRKRVFGSELF